MRLFPYETFVNGYEQYVGRWPTSYSTTTWSYSDKLKYNTPLKQQLDTKPTVASEEDILDMLGVDKAHG